MTFKVYLRSDSKIIRGTRVRISNSRKVQYRVTANGCDPTQECQKAITQPECQKAIILPECQKATTQPECQKAITLPECQKAITLPVTAE